jgi:hypothetical protein
VELDGAKKPKANSPPSDTMMVPGNSGLPGTRRSSKVHKAGTRRRAAMQIEMELMNAIDFNGLHLKACSREGLHRFSLHIYTV